MEYCAVGNRANGMWRKYEVVQIDVAHVDVTTDRLSHIN